MPLLVCSKERGSCAMNSMVKAFPTWPGLDMSKKVSEARARSTRSSNKMVTVMAVRIISEKSLKVKTSK